MFGDRRRASILHAVLMVVVATSFVATVVYMALDRWRPELAPIEMFGAAMSATVARPGQKVWVQVDRTRVRYCPGRSHMFWLSPRGDVVQAGIVPTSPSQEIGRSITRFQKIVPDLDPGQWCYAPQLVYDCDDRRYVVEQPAACLTVLPPAE